MRVLVATDGSEGSKAATEWLGAFPLPHGSEILVLAVANLPTAVLAIPPVSAYDQAVVDAARGTAEDARARLATRWPATEARVVDGDPRILITQHAEEWHADLIVVGARGLGAVSGFLLGSVSSAVVHHAHCPVLVVKDEPRSLLEVVMAVDGSEDALAAARFFAALPLDPATTVRLIGVVERPRYPYASPEVITPTLDAAVEELVADRRAAIEDALGRVEAELRDKVVEIERSTPVGLPADEIVAAARDAKADLVVIGARGLGAIKRLLLGSVSERVLHRVDCPVLIVKRH
jgi:nucleotide-binding universal stress UspA family protein